MGPALFLFSFIPYGGFDLKVRLAVGTVLWMSVWWVTVPVKPAITAFLPVMVNAVFSLTAMNTIISSYSSELIFLLAGANLISITWEYTGVDKRIAAKGLSLIGTSVKQQVVVWFLIATLLSSVLPNTVVAAILCSIAMSMLKFVGEGDLKKSKVAPPVLLAIVWGANNGGMLTPLGGAMNLVAVSYIEEIIGCEFMYSDWVIQMLPFGVAVTGLTLIVLMCSKFEQKTLTGTKEYFAEMYKSMPAISRNEVISLSVFIIAAGLAFTRQLYQAYLPDLKPGFVFLICGTLMFFLKDEKGTAVLSWESAEKNLMWGLFFLFAGGAALGTLVNGSGASQVLADSIAKINFSNEFFLILLIVTANVVLSDIINNTSCAAVTLPIVVGITQGLGLPVIPYVWIATASFNMSFTLPTSIRAIPIGHGLDPKYMFNKGLLNTVITIIGVTVVGWLCIRFWPGFGVLTIS
ncbi:MAG: SLC13 family permease [Oscillospiraceae bacterium]